MSYTTKWKSWLYLLGAVVLEVGGTTVMKASQTPGWLLGPNLGLIVMFALIGLSYYCLSLSVRGLPVGVAFAFWEGLGLILITLVSVLALGEGISLTRALALVAVLGGALLVNHGTEHGYTSNAADSPNSATKVVSAHAKESA